MLRDIALLNNNNNNQNNSNNNHNNCNDKEEVCSGSRKRIKAFAIAYRIYERK